MTKDEENLIVAQLSKTHKKKRKLQRFVIVTRFHIFEDKRKEIMVNEMMQGNVIDMPKSVTEKKIYKAPNEKAATVMAMKRALDCCSGNATAEIISVRRL